MLLKTEHEVLLASDVSNALTVLQEESVDLIITDLRMPGGSGIEVLRWAKRYQPEIQVIILTGFGELSTAMEAVELGAFAYIEKPFDSEMMLKQVRAGIEQYRHEQERRDLEQVALKGNRFETLGQLLAGTLHDLATPLSVIEGSLEMVAEAPERSSAAARLHTAQEQARHCRELVATAMNFVRHQRFDRTSFNLNDTALACVTLAEPILRKQSVAVTHDLAEGLPICKGDPVLVRQAILNLIANACHAMEGQAEPQSIALSSFIEADFACLSILDTGPGVDPDHRTKIFRAFYTSRGENGTGLGLTVVRNVMRRHGGHVVLREHEGGGALFVLKFPLGDG